MLVKNITLNRLRNGNATYGHLSVETVNHGIFKFTTIENKTARIQKGTYTMRFTHSPRFKYDTLELINVPKRTGIRIHPANFPHDIQGCIGIGLYNTLEEIPNMLHNSRQSTEILETLLRHGEHQITITDNEEQDIIKITRESST